ncbi:MAG: [citrate (pro-3S)-lyase] ligase, partial [Clostridiales bacterium]|nr:[citrate (pro-3S)-lyase] ligase [Clostridiales bacterium]
LISRAVFPAYFLKEEAAVTRAQAALDAQIFAQVARRLNITRRFVGEEPFSPATHLYNQEMAARLPGEGIMLQVIRRLDDPGGTPLSATRVRQALKAGDEKALTDLLPKTTLAYLKSEEGQALIKKRLAETE